MTNKNEAAGKTLESTFIKQLCLMIGKKISQIKVCEFGSWDGIHKSNIRDFVINGCHLGIFIESDEKKYKSLRKNYKNNENTLLLNHFVGTSNEDNIDSILLNNDISHLDFMSIDIDGNDYHVFDSLKKVCVDIICIEFNPTIPFDTDYVQPNNSVLARGASLLSFKKLGEKKGYTCLAVIGANVIFLRNDLVTDEVTEYCAREFPLPCGPEPISLYVGFDGSIFSRKKSIYLNWHKISVDIENISPVPRFLRQIPEGMPYWKKFLYFVWLGLKRPDKINQKNILNSLKKFYKK